jgi:hypothetical protein
MSERSWAELRRLVHERASGNCEYCQTAEINTGQTMHVDHIDPTGGDTLDNLCLACWNCNSFKHTATTEVNPDTGKRVPLFSPRTQIWSEHFAWSNDGTHISGLTPVGRSTIIRLKMNRPIIVAARRRWVAAGYHPPS